MKFFLAVTSFVLLFASNKAQPGGPPPKGGGPPKGPPSPPPPKSGSGSGSSGQTSQSRSGGSSGSGGQGGSDCSIDGSSSTLPACISKYFVNGILMDGNNNTCNSNKPITNAKLTLEQLLVKAEAVVRSGTCTGESVGGGGRGRKKRQQMSCSGTGVGNCDSTTTSRLQSIYGEKDLGDLGLLIVTNGVPNHCYKDGQEKVIGQVCENYRALLVPKKPVRAATYSNHSMGPIGIAKSGAFFFNHLSAETSCNVAAITEKPTFDTCDGHPSPNCQYHYHKAPNCIDGFQTCALLGYTNDGFPIYGKCNITVNGQQVAIKSCYRLVTGKNGCDYTHYVFDKSTSGCNLDEANGYYFSQDTTSTGGIFKAGTYGYFFTPEYPFSMPGYYGSKGQAKWCVISL